MRYLPHTDEEIRAMLARIGVPSIDALFDAVPPKVRLGRPLAVEPTLDEPQLMAHMEALAHASDAATKLSFLGGGIYDHHIPPAVDQLLLRSEFYTAYTPYQPEYSQGTLQAIFEFQTLVSQIFGLEVANASMYDGASASAEAVLMARRVSRKRRAVVSKGLHPEYIETIRTYLASMGEAEALIEVPLQADGRTDLSALTKAVDDDTACVLVGYPNFFGIVEDLSKIRESTPPGTLLVTATAEPYALSLIKPPGELGADICVGEGQALAVPPQLGGPGVGLFASKQKYVQKMPGRLCGETVDQSGARGFVLTLSTREQHIRRERATSNICTNHGLIALSFCIRVAMLGKQGFLATGRQCLDSAEYLKAEIGKLDGFTLPFAAPTFNEFVVQKKGHKAAELLQKLSAQDVLGGIDLGRFDPARSDQILIAVTERHSRADLDRLVSALAAT